MGLGFTLPIGSIETDTRFGVPDYDREDSYLLDGKELVLIGSSSDNPQLYKERQEGSFHRIRHHVDDSEDYWEVTDKGRSYSLLRGLWSWWRWDWLGPGRGGSSSASDISRGVYRWHLTRIEDAYGNTADYRYEYDELDRNTYISSIAYSGRDSADAFSDGKIRIDFLYDEPDHVLSSDEARLLGYGAPADADYLSLANNKRPDKRIDGRGGFVSKSSRRLDRIEIESFGEEIREYDFYYRLNEFGETVLDSYAEGRDGEEFYRYSFDYYGLDEAGSETREGYDGFDGVESSYSSGIWKYGLGGNDLFSFGFSGNIGGFASVLGIRLGVSGSLGGSVGYSRVLSSVMDIDGDGMAELVWNDSGNRSNLSGYNPLSGSDIALTGYNGRISNSQSSTMNFGGQFRINGPRGNERGFASFTVSEELER